MRIIFLCLLLPIFCAAKSASSDSTAEKYLDLDDNEDNVIVWGSLFTKINTILSETTKQRESQNKLLESQIELNESLVKLNKRQDTQELKLTSFMENTEKHYTDLKNGRDAQEPLLKNFVENTQKQLTDLNKGRDAQESILKTFIENTQNQFADLKKGRDAQEPILKTFMENTQTQLTDLKKGRDAQEPILKTFFQNTQKQLTDLKKGRDAQEPILNTFMENTEKKFTDLKKGQDAQERNLAHFMKHYFYNNNKWITILRRQDGSVNFYRNWTEYQEGFGNPYGEFFIGLEKLYDMTSLGAPQELMVVLKDFKNEQRIAKYDLFQIGNETEKYVLKELGKYSGDVGDSLSYHKGMMFSTYDQDNDRSKDYCCAENFKGAWWFNNCHNSHLFGPYRGEKNATNSGVVWGAWKGPYLSMKFAEMKIRSVSF